MKRIISAVLLMIIILSVVLTGCGKSNDYIINSENVVKIGVILSTSYDESYGMQVLDGIMYAAELAPSVNMKGKHSIELSVYDVNDNMEEIASKLISDKVAAVICAAGTKEKSDEIINAFDGAPTPLLFVDCYSDKIISDDESYMISIPYSYQSSVLTSYWIAEGYKNGAVICADDSYSKGFAKNFKETFLSSGGSQVNEYVYDENILTFDSGEVALSDPEFVFIIGNNNDCKEVYSLLDTIGVNASIAFSEMFDKTCLETSKYNNTLFISKLEIDVNNYIGADFLSVYSSTKNVMKADVSSAVAYGYDAYMLVYGALMGFNTSYDSDSEKSETEANTEVTVSEVKSALSEIVHLGVTDSINFDDSGIVNTNFVYLSTIENSNALMLNRYNYSNETN